MAWILFQSRERRAAGVGRADCDRHPGSEVEVAREAPTGQRNYVHCGGPLSGRTLCPQKATMCNCEDEDASLEDEGDRPGLVYFVKQNHLCSALWEMRQPGNELSFVEKNHRASRFRFPCKKCSLEGPHATNTGPLAQHLAGVLSEIPESSERGPFRRSHGRSFLF